MNLNRVCSESSSRRECVCACMMYVLPNVWIFSKRGLQEKGEIRMEGEILTNGWVRWEGVIYRLVNKILSG